MFFLIIFLLAPSDKTIAFSKYPVSSIYEQAPVPVDFSTGPEFRNFKTMIQHGIDQGVNFAGSYVIARWGCGSSCGFLVIINAKTGKICASLTSCGSEAYQKDSRLLMLHPIEDQEHLPDACTPKYFVLEGDELREITP